MSLRGALLGLLLYQDTEGLWRQSEQEQASVWALDRTVDLVVLLTGHALKG